ncbi:Maf family protein [Tahibacter amnicola]|uniref:7-methyl-GTP pyrophosphatase n=1 Tax=Tahibacter amnicola TaxID=2976241 RepID=A0ABY6BPE5_9GAMM|nr:Maf family nucleotide pyrophosphatase [Tahibacter amnicola]UXI69642.1 Maf family nucleotide pyrophosphatase [Tahibacter amnicola]
MSAVAVDVVLGSTSRYRAELLRRILPAFRQVGPDVDESRRDGEAPAGLAVRLARAKALAVAARCPGAIVIGSDQVAALDQIVLGKPGSVERARAQLSACSGRSVSFHTALCVVDAAGAPREALDTTVVRFRDLAGQEIDRYVAAEQPLDCAGSFKCEGLGITLFERIQNEDPTALIGLPLIALCRLLRASGLTLP